MMMLMNRKTSLILGVSLLGLPLVASADWSGKGEAGAALSTANSGAQNTTFTAKLDLASEIDKWKHAFGGSTIYTSSRAEASATDPDPQDETSAKRWELHEQSNYAFTPGTFWFGAVRHEADSIGSFEHQTVLSTGLGHSFIDNTQTKLVGQVGVGYKRFKQRSDLESDGDAIATGGLELKQVLTANTVLLDKLSVEAGSSNTLIQNDLALQVKMTDVLALSMGYQVRYNTKPGPRAFGSGDYAHSDRLLTANLVYEFK
jgi:putative salt-induced outer membrane protein